MLCCVALCRFSFLCGVVWCDVLRCVVLWCGASSRASRVRVHARACACLGVLAHAFERVRVVPVCVLCLGNGGSPRMSAGELGLGERDWAGLVDTSLCSGSQKPIDDWEPPCPYTSGEECGPVIELMISISGAGMHYGVMWGSPTGLGIGWGREEWGGTGWDAMAHW